MPSTNAPASRAQLVARARLTARIARGRAAFVRDARLLPIGLPLAALTAVGVLLAAQARPRPVWRKYSRRARREAAAHAAGLALLAAGGTLGATWLAAQAEWGRHERAYQTRDES
ncbi:hypothetical protein [Roseisolibacter sp. H3M3-2]|uniref:hypothetical protein n=1 Tax=Roseisolibacter sp. H3M3-2 TaxID=3031323 RepID=UPI0023DC0297|nr:hypothetical protein [Roseisolibacter sp. H3M3-2]MDF1504906.1 hypothetical protein [Roseisolibacter sp. H3M3-2]